AMEYLINHPEIPHGAIRVAFTPDEEIGRGPHKFDVERFNASLAYTVDGVSLGELQFESLNAAGAEVTFYGNNVHTGTAKGKMKHTIKRANQFIAQLPEKEAPEYTEGNEGFYHVLNIEGDVENTTLQMIMRDIDKDQFAKRKNYVKRIVKDVETTYGEDSIDLKLMEQYNNMREKIEPVKEVVDIAEQAMHNLQITPIIEPIRGGADRGIRSYKGLPASKISTAGMNFYGKNSFISIQNMETPSRSILVLCQLFTANDLSKN